MALKGASLGDWDAEYEKSFPAIKEYLASPLVLSQPMEREEFHLFLVVSTAAVSAALVKTNKEGRQRPVYFLSKMLTNVESRYKIFEQITLSLRVVTKKQRLYFQAHTIIVLSGYPIRVILHKPYTSRILMKWVIELSKFDIMYHPRLAIKGQVLNDFIIELSNVSKYNLPKPLWILETDGHSKAEGDGVGVVLQSLGHVGHSGN